MAPSLREGQLVLTVRPRRTIRRGAVVAVDSRQVGHRIVKRVVGLPGEHVTIDGGRICIDDELVPEPYASHSTYRGNFDVPERHYLLLGDNRDASVDSRAWHNPFVSRDEIVGLLVRRRRRCDGRGATAR
jgi:signal peptidase I